MELESAVSLCGGLTLYVKTTKSMGQTQLNNSSGSSECVHEVSVLTLVTG